MRKSKLKAPTQIDDLAVLAKLSLMPEWKVFERMVRNRVQYEKDLIIRLPEYNPTKLAIDKSHHMGKISGLLAMIKNVETASLEMEKLAEKEKE
jgi:hypothetical protein